MNDAPPASRISQAARGPAWRGDAIAFLWGLAEGIFFFIVPDLAFTHTAGTAPLRALRRVGLVILGSLVAGAVLFRWTSHDAQGAEAFVKSVPFVRETMFDQVRADYVASGAAAPLLGPTSGIPFKVYAVLAPHYLSLPTFLLVSGPARAERLLITWAQFAAAGWALRKWSRRPHLWVAILYAVYWTIVYAVYWSRV
jgi:uncharacterized protein YjeT (DUF2065 family)